ncbi:MFS transporter [Caenibacillus caldisaponilyticus]|uniref:MFS transporter n=1 Tax=Caenibacillus caldisaponilyticus TaxID=1674942 RepID=UPI001EE6D55B|nr:MFS transporter [Caenibacillus caldisaponilyticus]
MSRQTEAGVPHAVRNEIKRSGGNAFLLGQIEKRPAIFQNHPMIYALVLSAMLVNIISYIGPLYPAFVKVQLRSGAEVYGLIQAASVICGMLGGLLTGLLSRRFKTGRLMGGSLLFAGFCPIGIAVSNSVPLTMAPRFAQTFFTNMASIVMISARLALVEKLTAGACSAFRNRSPCRSAL